MKGKIQEGLAERKRAIDERLARKIEKSPQAPMFRGTNAVYELSDRVHAVGCGGIGLIHMLAKKVGLIDAIDERLRLFKIRNPYFESDHVLNIAYNLLAGGTCLDDIERRRQDAVFLDALGADRIPDPTTAGDFCRRFSEEDVLTLQEIMDDARLATWRRQPASFFELATIDLDGTMTTTAGECKKGMDISYKGEWGYHPLLVSLANTGEPLRIINRSGNRPSSEGAWAVLDDCIPLCRKAGFRRIRARGDTDFSQTEHLDRWDDEGDVEFIFGIDAMPNLVDLADELPKTAWKTLERRQKIVRQGPPRRRPKNVKQPIVVERQFLDKRLEREDVAEFDYQPTKCRRKYRMVVVRKHISEEKGGRLLFDDLRLEYLFYITNDRNATAPEIVFGANDRCDQENLIQQLKTGVRALTCPVGDLESNWAYMTMASLAWSLKAWLALWLPEPAEGDQKRTKTKRKLRAKRKSEKQTVLKMEFKKFVQYFMLMPAQIVQSGRRLIYRLLSWNPWQPVFFRAYEQLRC